MTLEEKHSRQREAYRRKRKKDDILGGINQNAARWLIDCLSVVFKPASSMQPASRLCGQSFKSSARTDLLLDSARPGDVKEGDDF